jgi:hypothetical protein
MYNDYLHTLFLSFNFMTGVRSIPPKAVLIEEINSLIKENKFKESEIKLLDLIIKFIDDNSPKPQNPEEENRQDLHLMKLLIVYYDVLFMNPKVLKEEIFKEYSWNSGLLSSCKNPKLINFILWETFFNITMDPSDISANELRLMIEDYRSNANTKRINLNNITFEYIDGEQLAFKLKINETLHILNFDHWKSK